MNPDLDLRDSTVSYVYKTAILFLSLDRMTPFWPDLGLRLEHIDEVKEAARRSVRAQMALDAALDPEKDDPDYGDKVDAHINAFLADVAQVEGAAAPVQVRAWIEDTLLPLEREWDWRYTWPLLVRRLPDHEPRLVASYGLPLDKTEALFAIARAWMEVNNAITERCAAADALPLEGWDAEAYADYCHNGPPGLTPFDALSYYLRRLAFERTWGEVRRLLNPAEMDALERWGMAYLKANDDSIPPHTARIPKERRSVS